MARRESHQQQFHAGPDSVRDARRLVTATAARWGLEGLLDDLALATSELASNAVLHARGAFGLVVRPLAAGARVEVIDRRPDLVPMAMPSPRATDLTQHGSTGRGLQIVAALATRWGFNTSEAHKSVWFEIVEGAPAASVPPVIELGHQSAPDPAARSLHLLGLPVAAAVASGVHVDDLVRELQLSTPAAVSPEDRQRLHELLDASAAARLRGRHAALEAAAQGHERYDLSIDASPVTLGAFVALNELLTTLGQRLSPGAAVPARVVDFRAWLLDEAVAQAAGNAPRPCPLPA